MKILEVTTLRIPEIKVIRFARFCDQRGYFTESYRASDFASHPEMGFMKDVRFVQANESFSKRHVARGMHFQWNPHMGKMVRTISGRMIDLVLDIRRGSPTYGKMLAVDLPGSAERPVAEWIWVPPGFAHGNLFTAPTVIEYLCSGEYSAGCEACISPLSADIDWSLADPALKAVWDEIRAQPDFTMTDKDRNGLSLAAWTDDSRSQNFVHGKL